MASKTVGRVDYVPVGSYCSNCKYKQAEAFIDHRGNQQEMWTCTSEYSRDPVTGEQVSCTVARSQLAFCGLDGRYFEEKQEPVKAPVFHLKLVNNDDSSIGALSSTTD